MHDHPHTCTKTNHTNQTEHEAEGSEGGDGGDAMQISDAGGEGGQGGQGGDGSDEDGEGEGGSGRDGVLNSTSLNPYGLGDDEHLNTGSVFTMLKGLLVDPPSDGSNGSNWFNGSNGPNGSSAIDGDAVLAMRSLVGMRATILEFLHGAAGFMHAESRLANDEKVSQRINTTPTY